MVIKGVRRMPSHVDVAKRIFEDARERLGRHADPAQWDLLTGLSELCLAVEALQVDIQHVKTEIKNLQH